MSRRSAFLLLLTCDHPDCPHNGEPFPFAASNEPDALAIAIREGWRVRDPRLLQDRCPACVGAVREVAQ
jgi:hypothetical protein